MKDVIIAIIGSGLLSTLINVICNKKIKRDNTEEAVMQLLGMEIRRSCEYAIQNNKISAEELEQIQSMNALYKKMGGNGYVRVLMCKIEQLEVFIEE